MLAQTNLPTNQKFGYFFSTFILILAAHFYYINGFSISAVSAFITSLFFYIATIRNFEILTPLNKSWFLLGQMMGKLVSPVVLGLIFFLLITPIGLIGKLLGRDQLGLKRSKLSTYWIEPVGSNSEPESFKNQF